MDAVRVPPSAWRTSQSTVMVRSPSAAEFDEHRSFGVFGVVSGKLDDAKIAGLSAAGTHWNSFNVLPGRSGIIACLPHGRAIARAVSQSGGTEYYGGQ